MPIGFNTWKSKDTILNYAQSEHVPNGNIIALSNPAIVTVFLASTGIIHRDATSIPALAQSLQDLARTDPGMARAVRAELSARLSPADSAALNRMLAGDLSLGEGMGQAIRNPRQGLEGAAKGIANFGIDVANLFARGAMVQASSDQLQASAIASALGREAQATQHIDLAHQLNNAPAPLERFTYDTVAENGGAGLENAAELGLGFGSLIKKGAATGVRVAATDTMEGGGRVSVALDAAESGSARMFSSSELLGVERASPELIASVSSKRSVVIARQGSDELRMLDYFGAEASVNTAENGVLNGSILLRENPSKAAILEEFLHGTQARLGVTDRLGTSGLGSAETHVKDFMIRHESMLGLGKEDVEILKTLRDKGF